MTTLRSAAVLAAVFAFSTSAQAQERFTLRGNDVAIYNIAGKVTIEHGGSGGVVVEVTRGGSDGRQLKIEERTVDGRPSLCVVYPDERIIYPQRGHSSFNNSTNARDCRGGVSSGMFFGRRVEVASSGKGVEAWADLRIIVPAGQSVRVNHMVGNVDVSNVDATLRVDVSSATVTSRDTRGKFMLNTGSGGVTVSGHEGEMLVDVGSGSVRIDRVSGPRTKVETGSGGINASDIKSDSVGLGTGSGSITASGISARRVHVETGSGGASVGLLSNADDVSVSTGSGSVDVTLPSNFSARVDISTGSGGIRSDLPVEVIGRTQRNELHGTIGGGRGHLKVETGSGGVHLLRGSGVLR